MNEEKSLKEQYAEFAREAFLPCLLLNIGLFIMVIQLISTQQTVIEPIHQTVLDMYVKDNTYTLVTKADYKLLKNVKRKLEFKNIQGLEKEIHSSITEGEEDFLIIVEGWKEGI